MTAVKPYIPLESYLYFFKIIVKNRFAIESHFIKEIQDGLVVVGKNRQQALGLLDAIAIYEIEEVLT